MLKDTPYNEKELLAFIAQGADPLDAKYKVWYQAGWFNGTALATSSDGIRWEKTNFDVVEGTNLVLDTKKQFKEERRRDGVSVWLDHDAVDISERYKMYWWGRYGEIGGQNLEYGTGYIFTSADGIHWNFRGGIGKTGDNSTFYYSPFTKKWCFTMRRFGRARPPWNPNTWNGVKRGRARSYWETDDFLSVIRGWHTYDPVFWFGADRFDMPRTGYDIGGEPQFYKVDAVGYESLMLGMITIHYGPENEICQKEGYPKLTELQLAFSRDGFHWDRSNRETFIGATLNENSWERAYIHSVGGFCVVSDDILRIYYTGFKGDPSNLNPIQDWNGMYANSSMGMVTLRRDGFASLDAAEGEQIVFTRPLSFDGKYLFVNVDSSKGLFRVEVCDLDGNPIPEFTKEDCNPIASDVTKAIISWKMNKELTALRERPIRFKFYLENASFYSFWVSPNFHGVSRGPVGAGGPTFKGAWDI